MLEKEKYYGEVWLPDNEEVKFFCVLKRKKGKIFLTSNIKKDLREYKLDLIFGVFTGLGYLTFINNKVVFSQSGMIVAKIYNPEYTFVGNHFVNTNDLSLKEFTIENNEIIKWIWYNLFNHEYENNTVSHDGHINKDVRLDKLGIVFSLNTGLNTSMLRDKVNLENYGYVKFESESRLSLLDAVELYNRFQKFLFFFHGSSSQFTEFKFKCLNCDKWIQLYYNDKLSREGQSDFVNLNFKDLESEIENLFIEWFTNDEMLFCIDVILENSLSVKISHSRRFINSVFSFEAMVERFFPSKLDNPTLKKYLNFYKVYFIEIANIEESHFNNFLNKIIRSRDYYVHSKKSQSQVFSEFELLYVSFLLDYIVAIELLERMNISKENIDKIKMRAKNKYINGQTINKLLNQNVFLQPKK